MSRATDSTTPAPAATVPVAGAAATSSRRGEVAGAALATVALVVGLLAGCATPPEPPSPPPQPGLTELLQRPAERALYDGMRAYDDGQFLQAESHLRRALDNALRNPHDRASAHKLLAFITCISNRLVECEAEFRAARAADPTFLLTRSEAGHPQWGPVYRRVVP